jgi:L,D-peptidoglycan transpeptidase YkuD (ErfK/YbiS/YcfS/YnhG family)
MTRKRVIVITALLSLLSFISLPFESYAKTNMVSKSESEGIVNHMRTLKDTGQLILVTASSSNTSFVKVQTFTKDRHGKWHRQLVMDGITGKYGLTHHFYEGSKNAPAGKYTITQAFGRYKNPGTKLPYHRITPDDVWVDNVHSIYYNTLQSKRKTHEKSENMNILQYDYGFVINYNTKRIKGKGSAIFFHIDTGHYNYTLGCTAVTKSNVIRILKWLDPKKKPVIIQTVESELNRY